MSTNAGGSNVVRYGTARALCLGIEAVLPDGSIIDTLSGLRKDNTGYDLRDLLIGAEGTLGVITGAALRLYPEPLARVTGFVSVPDLSCALKLLNVLQDASGEMVEAFEYMPSNVVDTVRKHFTQIRPPLEGAFDTGILLEVGISRRVDAEPDAEGVPPIRASVVDALGAAFERGLVLDASIAATEQHRADLWSMRESVLEAVVAEGPGRHLDIALPLENIPAFLAAVAASRPAPSYDRAFGRRQSSFRHLRTTWRAMGRGRGRSRRIIRLRSGASLARLGQRGTRHRPTQTHHARPPQAAIAALGNAGDQGRT